MFTPRFETVMTIKGQVIWLTHRGLCKYFNFGIKKCPSVKNVTSNIPVVGRYLLRPGYLSVPATGCRLTQCMPDGATHENTEGFQHSNTGPILLLLQCHFGARPTAGPAPSQSVSLRTDSPVKSMSSEVSAVNLLTPRRVVWPINEPRKVYFLAETTCWNYILHLQARPGQSRDKKRLKYWCYNVLMWQYSHYQQGGFLFLAEHISKSMW